MQESATQLADKAFEEEKLQVLKRAKTLLYRVIKKERARKERRRKLLEEHERRKKQLEEERAAAAASVAAVQGESSSQNGSPNVQSTHRSVARSQIATARAADAAQLQRQQSLDELEMTNNNLDESLKLDNLDGIDDDSAMESALCSEIQDGDADDGSDWLTYNKLAAVAHQLEQTKTPDEFNTIVLDFLQKIYSDYVQYRKSEQLRYREFSNAAPVITPRRKKRLKDIGEMSKVRMEERSERAVEGLQRRQQYGTRVKELREQELEKAEEARRRRAEAAMMARLEAQRREMMEKEDAELLEKHKREEEPPAPTTIEGWLSLPILKDVVLFNARSGRRGEPKQATPEDLFFAAQKRTKNLEKKKRRLQERIRKGEEMYKSTLEWEQEATKKMDEELGSLRHHDLNMYVPPWMLDEKDRIDLDKVRLAGEGVFEEGGGEGQEEKQNENNVSFFMTEVDEPQAAATKQSQQNESDGDVDDEYEYDDISDDVAIAQGSAAGAGVHRVAAERHQDTHDSFSYTSKEQSQHNRKKSRSDVLKSDKNAAQRSVSPVGDALLRMTLHQLSSHLMMKNKRQMMSPEPHRSSPPKREIGKSPSPLPPAPQPAAATTAAAPASDDHWTSAWRAKKKKKAPYVPQRNFSPPPLREEHGRVTGAGGLVYAQPRGRQHYVTPAAHTVTTSHQQHREREAESHESTHHAKPQERKATAPRSRGSIRLINSREVEEMDYTDNANSNFETRLLKLSSRDRSGSSGGVAGGKPKPPSRQKSAAPADTAEIPKQ